MKREKIEKQLFGIEAKLKKSYERQKENDEALAILAIKNNPKYFYAYARRKQSTRSTIGPLETNDSTLLDDPKDMAEALQEQYTSVQHSKTGSDSDLS